jgi:DNA uptake protein ComE-like DNA-binding protein
VESPSDRDVTFGQRHRVTTPGRFEKFSRFANARRHAVRHNIINTAVIAAALLLASGLALAAAEPNAAMPGEAKSASATTAKMPPKKAYPKLVDINSASKVELKKLRGIGDAEADRIIAGRPYLSKAHLVTHKVIPQGIYEPIKNQIIAVQKPAASKK